MLSYYLNYHAANHTTMRQTRFIAFTSQKGGVGKSTFNILAASSFHFANAEVAVIDCDQPQSSITKLRENELAELESNSDRQELFSSLGRPAYSVFDCSLEEAALYMKKLDGKVDLVFIDMPGTLNNPALPAIWANLDYIFIPLEADELSIAASEGFVAVIEGYIKKQPGSKLKGYYAFWNRHNKSVKQDYYQEVESYFQEQKIPMLHSKIEQSINYTRKSMRSTLFPPEKQHGNAGLPTLMKELANIIYGQPNQNSVASTSA